MNYRGKLYTYNSLLMLISWGRMFYDVVKIILILFKEKLDMKPFKSKKNFWL